MIHAVRWTARKLSQRLALVENLVYRRQAPLAPLRFRPLPDPLTPPPVEAELDDSAWPAIQPHTHWGSRNLNFILRGRFTVPDGWRAGGPAALYLPLGVAGDFSHPEALAYVDGRPLAACDRHHQEIILPEALADGREHTLALHGWTGLIQVPYGDPGLYMGECAVVQVDQPTRDFLATARVALGIAQHLEANSPVKGALLNALDAAFLALDLREPFGDAFYASVPVAHACLREGLAQAGAA
ncbi:MAG TPA: alpha-mannosidase, partial [Caldilineaceae bacterium]|nr:alpha-mannosidase [Caldilineaceae bacterium]